MENKLDSFLKKNKIRVEFTKYFWHHPDGFYYAIYNCLVCDYPNYITHCSPIDKSKSEFTESIKLWVDKEISCAKCKFVSVVKRINKDYFVVEK